MKTPQITMYLKSRSLSTLIVTLTVMLLNNFSYAEERKVGVAVSAVINGSTELGPEISETLAAALAATLKVSTVAGVTAQNLLPTAARSETCLGDSACLVTAAKALHVDELLMLIIVVSAEEIKVEATWVNADDGQTALRPSISSSKDEDQMADVFGANAQALLPGIELRVQPSHSVEPNDPPASSHVSPAKTAGTTQGRHFTTTSKTLMIGGALALSSSLAYGGYRRSQCGSFSKCDTERSKTTDILVDAVGVAGTVSLSIATYLYFSSASETQPPVAVTMTRELVGVSYGGKF